MAALALPSPATAQSATPARDSSGLERIKLAEGIYLFRALNDLDYWTSSNTVVIINDADVTLFDSSTRPATSRLVLAEIRKLTTKPVRTLVNSHWHMDHWLGNGIYASAFPGLQVVATTETRDFMKRMPTHWFLDEIGLERSRARVDTAIQRGKLADGTPLTAAKRRELEASLRTTAEVAAEIAAAPRILPTVAFSDSLILWSGPREFRLFTATGDASGSAVLYLPNEKILVAGDVLVRSENGEGGQPWTTNSYQITPWLASLQKLDALDAAIIVPGQGPPLYDKAYLRLTIALYQSIIAQVHSALEAGAARLGEVQAVVKLDSIRTQFTHGDPALDERFNTVAGNLIRRVFQEAHDGIVVP